MTSSGPDSSPAPNSGSTLKTVSCLTTIFFIGAPTLSGGYLLATQVFGWLTRGEWTPISVLDAMKRLGFTSSWIDYPTSWIGVWKILDFLPASIAGILLSVGIAICAMMDQRDRESR